MLKRLYDRLTSALLGAAGRAAEQVPDPESLLAVPPANRGPFSAFATRATPRRFELRVIEGGKPDHPRGTVARGRSASGSAAVKRSGRIA